MSLRILVADDHEVVRQGICSILNSHLGWEVCGEAVDGRQAVQMVKDLKPQIVILDIDIPMLNGLDATRQILNERRRIWWLPCRHSNAMGHTLRPECATF